MHVILHRRRHPRHPPLHLLDTVRPGQLSRRPRGAVVLVEYPDYRRILSVGKVCRIIVVGARIIRLLVMDHNLSQHRRSTASIPSAGAVAGPPGERSARTDGRRPQYVSYCEAI